RPDAGHLEHRPELARALEIVDHVVALGVHVRADVMRDLAGEVRDPDAAVERRGADPELAAVDLLVRAPEAHVVPLPGAPADLLLEGEVLAPPEEIEVAHGRGRVRAIERDALGDV